MIGVERRTPATDLPDNSRSTRPHAPDLRRAAARTATPGTDPASRHPRTPIRRRLVTRRRAPDRPPDADAPLNLRTKHAAQRKRLGSDPALTPPPPPRM